MPSEAGMVEPTWDTDSPLVTSAISNIMTGGQKADHSLGVERASKG